MSDAGLRSGLTNALEGLFTDIQTPKRDLVKHLVVCLERHMEIGMNHLIARTIERARPSREEMQKRVQDLKVKCVALEAKCGLLEPRIAALEAHIFEGGYKQPPSVVFTSVEDRIIESEKRAYAKGHADGMAAAGEYVAKYHMPSLPDLSAWRDGMANTLFEEAGKPHVKRGP